MEAPELFVMSIAAMLTALFAWAFRALPRERWQFLVAVPLQRNATGAWQGLNLTYYGLFNALAAVLGTAMVFVMLGGGVVNALQAIARGQGAVHVVALGLFVLADFVQR